MKVDYVKLNKNNKLIMSYNQELLKENQSLKKQIDEYQKALDDTMSEKIDLEEENKQLKDRYYKLKEYVRKTKLNEFEKSYGKRYSKTFTQAEVIVCNIIIDHMQELEKVYK